jgi:hypothetical protein
MRYFLLSVLCLSVLFVSCKKDEGGGTPAGDIVVSGVVQNFGGAAVANASVSLYSGTTASGTAAATGVTSASGQWQLNLTTAGRYTCVIVQSGLTAVRMVDVQSGQTTVAVGTVVLAGQRINGVVNDAQNGQAIAGAIVRFFVGSNNDTSGYHFPDITTNSSGGFTTTLTIGSYVYTIFASGRVPLVANHTISDTIARQLTTTITRPLAAGRMRIVLNWGAQPSDLDSHLTGDSSTVTGRPRYHVYYGNQVVKSGNDTIAYLDWDDVTSYGPETITIYRFFPGTLRYKIHDFSYRNSYRSHYMSDSSSAIVRVYTSAGLIREDRIARGIAGNQWYVYDINGSTQAVNFVGTIRDSVSSPTDPSFKPIPLPAKNAVK